MLFFKKNFLMDLQAKCRRCHVQQVAAASADIKKGGRAVDCFLCHQASLSLHLFPRKTTANEDIRRETNEATRAAADHCWIGLPVSFNSCGDSRWSLWLRVMQNEGARLSAPSSGAPPRSLLAAEQTPTHKRGGALRSEAREPGAALRGITYAFFYLHFLIL